MKTTFEQIEETQNAISAIKSGAQEYRIGNRMVKRGDLKTLEDSLEKLVNRYNQEQNSGPFGYTSVTEFTGR